MTTAGRGRAAAILGLLLVLAALPALAASEAAAPIGPGVHLRQIYNPRGPWVVHVVEADLSEEYLELHALLGGGDRLARSPLPQMVACASSETVRPVAAVNGDFFALAGGDYAAIPLGFHVVRGEMVTFPEPCRSVLYVLSDGTVHIGRFRANAWLQGREGLLLGIAAVNRPPGYADLVLFTPRFGDETRADPGSTHFALVGLSGPIRPDAEVTAKIASITRGACQRIPPDGVVLAARGISAYAMRKLEVGDAVTLSLDLEPEVAGIQEAVGGGPRLVRDGLISVEHLSERFADSFAQKRHPRAGVGVRDGTLVLVAVDGRQPGYSEGMTLYEFAQLFLELGCSDAMNLDGGGSATLVVRGEVVNSPSGGVPRAVANALALFSAAPVGAPVRLTLLPSKVCVMRGCALELEVVGLDEHYNEVPMDAAEVEWECAAPLGEVDESGVFQAARVDEPTMGLISAHADSLAAAAFVRVVPAPARVVVVPEEGELMPGGVQQFRARAYDEENQPVHVGPEQIAWSCEPSEAGARVTADGLLRAPDRECELTVTARVAGRSGSADLAVKAPAPPVVERRPAPPEPAVVEDFESEGAWSYESRPRGVPGAVKWVADSVAADNKCLRLEYDFSGGAETRTAHARLNRPLGDAQALSVRVLGDGRGCWLRARVRGARGEPLLVDLAPKVTWADEWRTLTVSLPPDAKPPLTLESIYVATIRESGGPAGAICLDDIVALPAGAAAPRRAAEAAPGRARPRKEEGAVIELPRYSCRRTAEPITIDGRIAERAWSRIPAVGDFTLVHGKERPQLPTEVRACWDDRYLYLAFVCVDTDIWGTLRERDAPIYEEEVAEAFISSCGEVTRYFEFNFSPHNVVFDARIQCPESGDRHYMTADVDWNCEGLRSAVQVSGTLDDPGDVDDRWTVEVALPFSEIGRDGKPPAEGEEWRVNFYRIDRAERGEFSCWSPTLSDPPNFHVPRRFGHLVFSQPPG